MSEATRDWQEHPLRVKIIGVGGAGGNAVDRLRMSDAGPMELAVVNTDFKTLDASPLTEKVMIGKTVTGGLSTGGEAELGRQAAEADREELSRLVEGVDLVFILAGLGRGTGSGAAPVLAEVAAEAGALVVAFVNLPFSREGQRRMRQAEDALAAMRDSCACVISLPNDLIVQQAEGDPTLLEALAIADDWIRRGVQAIYSMILENGLINVDFATLRGALHYRGGKAVFGFGEGAGDGFVEAALRDLERCPLLHLPDNRFLRKTDGLILNIRGGPDMPLSDVYRIMDFIGDRFGCKENTVLGAVVDGSLQGRVQVTVIGTVDVTGARRHPYRVPAAARPRPLPAVPPPPRPAAAPAPAQAPNAAAPSSASAESHGDTSFAAPGRPAPPQAGNAPSARRGINPPEGQAEFEFLAGEDRGYFEKTDENIYEGQDLDVPTFIRKGIRIAV